MSFEYARQKLEHAVWSMAGSEQPLRKRMEYALIDIIPVGEDDFPTEDLKAEWQALRARCSSVPGDGQEGAYHATLSAMDDDEIRSTIEQFTSLLAGMLNYRDDLMTSGRH